MPASAPAFAPARELLALRMARLSLVTEWLEEHHGGLPLGPDGEPLPAGRLEAELIGGVEKALAALGLDVVSAAKVGVDVVRARDLARDLRDLDAAEGKAS
jgi:hypothetical protein